MSDPRPPQVSVVIPVTEAHDNLLEIHELFEAEGQRLGRSIEFLFMVDGGADLLEVDLAALARRDGVRVIRLAFTYDESAALCEGFKRARGRWIVTLPAYHSVHPSALSSLLDKVEVAGDCALAVRSRRRDPLFNRIQARIYNGLVSLVAGRRLRDISTGALALRSEVAREMNLYGDQYRFLPVLLAARGYRMVEVEVPQSRWERDLRVFGPGTYLRRLVDLATIFFLVRFTKRPLRFFGILGGGVASLGLLLCLFLTYQRILQGRSLANRPALLLGVLLLVLGVQTISLGLLGELVVHLQSQREMQPEAEEILEPEERPQV